MERTRQVFSFIARVARRFLDDACPQRAAALAFSTLFALVPLIATVFAVLTGFGVFDSYLDLTDLEVVGQLVPAFSAEVAQSIQQFAANTRTLGTLGFVLFVVTATILVRNMHVSLNTIWRFRSSSTVWNSVATYTAVIVLGTALLAVSFVLGPLVQSVLASAIPDREGFAWFRGSMVSVLVLFVTLFLLNIVVPSGRVRMASAALGAGVSAIIWEISKSLFVLWTGSVMRLSVIYGSLAAVPIFLIWLYLSWFIALAGAELGHAFQFRDEFLNPDDENRRIDTIPEVVELCVRTYLEVASRFSRGSAPMGQEDLDAAAGTLAGDLVRNTLEDAGLVITTDRGLLPARRLDHVTVGSVVEALVRGTGRQVNEAVIHVAERHGERAIAPRLLEIAISDPDMPITSDKILNMPGRLPSRSAGTPSGDLAAGASAPRRQRRGAAGGAPAAKA